MQYITHLLAGFCVFLWLRSGTVIEQAILLLGVLFFSLLPDIDYHKSKLGKFLFFLNFGVKHRGFLHSLFGVCFLWLIMYFFALPFAAPLLVSYCSHLLLDAMTKSGIRPFYPFNFKIKGFVKTGGIIEWICRAGLVVLVVVLLV